MEHDVLKIINAELSDLGLHYEYDEFTGELVYPYLVGEFSESGYAYEDNATNGEMILTCFHRGSRADMIRVKELIKDRFRDYRCVVDGGAIHIAYTHELFLRSGEADLKKMEIYLEIRYWEGE